VRAGFDALKASDQPPGRLMLSLSGSTSVVSIGIVSGGAAIISLAAPLINLVGGFYVLLTAFETAAGEQIKVAGRARARSNPAAIGASRPRTIVPLFSEFLFAPPSITPGTLLHKLTGSPARERLSDTVATHPGPGNDIGVLSQRCA